MDTLVAAKTKRFVNSCSSYDFMVPDILFLYEIASKKRLKNAFGDSAAAATQPFSRDEEAEKPRRDPKTRDQRTKVSWRPNSRSNTKYGPKLKD